MTSRRPALFTSFFLVAVAIAGCATSSAVAPDTAAQRGQRVAVRDCGGCHAIDAKSESSRFSAPPFRDIRRRYNRISLAREFVAIGQGGHYQMPPTQISSSDGADLIAFIESLGT
jgi:mono/diheme cytochrome c family protein